MESRSVFQRKDPIGWDNEDWEKLGETVENSSKEPRNIKLFSTEKFKKQNQG